MRGAEGKHVREETRRILLIQSEPLSPIVRGWSIASLMCMYTVPVYRISFTRACVWVCVSVSVCVYRVVRPFQIVPRHIVHVYKLHRSRVLAKSVITTIIENGYRVES